MRAKYIKEDWYQEPDYKQRFLDNQERSVEEIEKFVEEWVDNNIGLDAADQYAFYKYHELIEIKVSQKKRIQDMYQKSHHPTHTIDMTQEWKESGEDLLNELTRDNGFTRFWDFELLNWNDHMFYIEAHKKEYKF
jgi:hypothetical protein